VSSCIKPCWWAFQGWTAYKSPKRYKKYGSQKGWERVNQPPADKDGFRETVSTGTKDFENNPQALYYSILLFL